jgi:DNA modification methylase
MQNYRLILRMIDEQNWILRNTIIWHKPNHMPSSVKDRFTNAYEPVFMLVKNNKPVYYYNTKTGLMQTKKPLGIHGKEGIDWDWEEVPVYEKDENKKQDMAGNPTYVGFNARWQGKTKTKRKKVSNWRSLDYWFDLDAVRVPYSESGKQRRKYVLSKFGSNPNNPMGKLSKGLKGGSEPIFLPEEPHPLGKNPGDLWTIPTQPFPEAHFAVYPEKLIEPMIKAGCPQWICRKCGLARMRIVEKGEIISTGGSNHGKWAKSDDENVQGKRMVASARYTIGWTDCGCGAGWRPGIVLDPFLGSGTTMKLCLELRRSCVGIEINPSYINMTKKRLNWNNSLGDVEFEFLTEEDFEECDGR